MNEPVRTCVGCRERAPRSQLLRVVVRGSALLVDVRRVLPGRGAHLHPCVQCLQQAQKRRAFERALRVAGPLDTAAVRAALATADDAATVTR